MSTPTPAPVQYGQGFVDHLKAEHAAEVRRLDAEKEELERRLAEASSKAIDLAERARLADLLSSAVRGEPIDATLAENIPVLAEAVRLRREWEGMNRRRQQENDRRRNGPGSSRRR